MTTNNANAAAVCREISKKVIRERYKALREKTTEQLQVYLLQPQLRAADIKAIERIYRERGLPAPQYGGSLQEEAPRKVVINPQQLSPMRGVVDKNNTKPWREIVSFIVGLVTSFLLWNGQPGVALVCGIIACAAVFLSWGWVEGRFSKDKE